MNFNHLRISLLVLNGTLLFGTAGYYIFEDMTFFESFYMTIITISTVGFSEIKPLTLVGRIITIIIIATGVAIGGYTLGMLFRMVIEGELRKSFGRRKVEKQIAALKNHYIICGFGRIGRLICRELDRDGIAFVVIEYNPKAIEVLEKEHYLYLKMDATTEEALEKAGISQAKGLVTAVNSDANNVFINLTAKGLRPDIFILSRATDELAEGKLMRAGATRVVSPYLIGGRRMAEVLKRPTVVDFLDIAMVDSHLGLSIQEAKILHGSELVGKNIVNSNLRKDYGVIIVAIKKSSGEMCFNPRPSDVLEAGDVIISIGMKDDLVRMQEVLSTTG